MTAPPMAHAAYPLSRQRDLQMLMKKNALLIADSAAPDLDRQSTTDDLLLFVRNAIANPRSVGALIPASQALATKMAIVCDSLKPSALIELGPGTGVITEKIRHLTPTLVEIDEQFSARLSVKFPELQVANQCAAEFLEKLDRPTGCICSIPLINNPAATAIKAAISKSHAAGLLEWVAIYSYGNSNPLTGCGFKNEQRVATIPFNFPPARIWLNS